MLTVAPLLEGAPCSSALFAVFSVFFFYKTRIVPNTSGRLARFLGMALPGALLHGAPG